MQPKQMQLPVSSLKTNPWNTNIVSPENQLKLEASIKEFGFFRPIVVREIGNEYEILGGQHRSEVAASLGIKEIPVMNLGPISDIQAKQISLADNARYGLDDTVALSDLLKDMGDMDHLQQILPYTEADLDEIFTTVDIALSELDIDENFENDAEPEITDDNPAPKAAKTHTIMRFKVPIGDADRLTALIARTERDHGFKDGDQLTNAGDALVHLLGSGSSVSAELPTDTDGSPFALDDLGDLAE